MSLTALTLVLIGASLHAMWNYVSKLASGGAAFAWLTGFVSSLLSLPLIVWQLHVQGWPSAAVGLAAMVSALLHLIYFLCLQTGYRLADFSVVYPLARGTGPLLTVLAAMLILGERPTALAGLGIALILIGILSIAGGCSLLYSRSDRLTKGVFWGVMTGALIACYTVVDGYAIKKLTASPMTFYLLSLPIRTLMHTPFAWATPVRRINIRQVWQHSRWHVLCVAALSPLAYSLVLAAVQISPLSYVAPVREVSMLLGTFLGVHWLSEPDTKRRLLGATVLGLGVAFLALA